MKIKIIQTLIYKIEFLANLYKAAKFVICVQNESKLEKRINFNSHLLLLNEYQFKFSYQVLRSIFPKQFKCKFLGVC